MWDDWENLQFKLHSFHAVAEGNLEQPPTQHLRAALQLVNQSANWSMAENFPVFSRTMVQTVGVPTDSPRIVSI